jgi:hypothetical protein
VTAPVAPAAAIESHTPLKMTRLSPRAVIALARPGQHRGRAFVASADQVHNLYAIGSKTAAEVLDFQEFCARPVCNPSRARPSTPSRCCSRRWPIHPEPVERLGLAESINAALRAHALVTIGQLAGLTGGELLTVSGVGPKRRVEIIESLHRFNSAGRAPTAAHTMDGLWEAAARQLSDKPRQMVERVLGLFGAPEKQVDIAADLGVKQPSISTDYLTALALLDTAVLEEPIRVIDELLQAFHGLLRVDELARKLEERWPRGAVSSEGMVRLLAKLEEGRLLSFEVEGVSQPLVARPMFDRASLRSFCEQASRLAREWPPIEPTSPADLVGHSPHLGDPWTWQCGSSTA